MSYSCALDSDVLVNAEAVQRGWKMSVTDHGMKMDAGKLLICDCKRSAVKIKQTNWRWVCSVIGIILLWVFWGWEPLSRGIWSWPDHTASQIYRNRRCNYRRQALAESSLERQTWLKRVSLKCHWTLSRVFRCTRIFFKKRRKRAVKILEVISNIRVIHFCKTANGIPYSTPSEQLPFIWISAAP